MNTLPNQKSLTIAKFENFLVNIHKVSGKTLRNYRADLSLFSAWATLYLQANGIRVNDFEAIVPHISAQLVASYKGNLLEKNTPEATINRQLSTLRNFARFLLTENMIKNDPTVSVSNIKRELGTEEKVEALINEFKKHLETEGISKVTLKNYLSDVRHFLSWSLGQTCKN